MVLIGAFVGVTCDARDVSEEHLFDVVKRSAEPEPEPENGQESSDSELEIEVGQDEDRVYQVWCNHTQYNNTQYSVE